MVNSVYSAYHDGFVSNVWGIAGNALALVSLVVVTQFQGGLPLLVIALSGTRMAVAMGSGWYAFFRRYPWLAPAPSESGPVQRRFPTMFWFYGSAFIP